MLAYRSTSCVTSNDTLSHLHTRPWKICLVLDKYAHILTGRPAPPSIYHLMFADALFEFCIRTLLLPHFFGQRGIFRI